MQTKRNLFSVVSGILMIIVTLFSIDSLVGLMEFFAQGISGASFASVISFFANRAIPIFYIVLIAAFFKNNRKIALVAYILIAAFGVIGYIAFGSMAGYSYRADYTFGLIALAHGIISHYNSILSFAIEGVMIFLLLASTMLSDKINKKILKYTWFVPAVLYFVCSDRNPILGIYHCLSIGYGVDFFDVVNLNNLEFIVTFLAYLSIGLWASDIYAPKPKEGDFFKSTSSSEGYYDLAIHILLLLLTFGIWYCIWIYKTTSYLNNTPDEEYRNPTKKLLLCMFVPFYCIYWTYKSAQRIDKLAFSKGQSSDISTLCLILSIFVGIIPPIIMQDKINNIVTKKTDVAVTANTDATSARNTTPPAVGIADELKKYKELLDSGVITQEEFEAKKKELLGL